VAGSGRVDNSLIRGNKTSWAFSQLPDASPRVPLPKWSDLTRGLERRGSPLCPGPPFQRQRPVHARVVQYVSVSDLDRVEVAKSRDPGSLDNLLGGSLAPGTTIIFYPQPASGATRDAGGPIMCLESWDCPLMKEGRRSNEKGENLSLLQALTSCALLEQPPGLQILPKAASPFGPFASQERNTACGASVCMLNVQHKPRQSVQCGQRSLFSGLLFRLLTRRRQFGELARADPTRDLFLFFSSRLPELSPQLAPPTGRFPCQATRHGSHRGSGLPRASLARFGFWFAQVIT